jgi:hypothetical protein
MSQIYFSSLARLDLSKETFGMGNEILSTREDYIYLQAEPQPSPAKAPDLL